MEKKQQQQRRNKGEDSIVQLPDGKYKVTITISTGVDGKQKRKSSTCKGKQELFDKIAELKVTFKLADASTIPSKTFKEYAEAWLDIVACTTLNSLSFYSMYPLVS